MLEGSFVSVEESTTLVVVSSTVVDVDVPSLTFFSYSVITVVFSVLPSEVSVDTVGFFCMVPGSVASRAFFATCSGVRFSCEPDAVSAVLSPPSEAAGAPDAAFSVPADISGAAVFIAAGATPSPPSGCTAPLVADVAPSPLDTEDAPTAVFTAGAGIAVSALGAEGALSVGFAAGAGAGAGSLFCSTWMTVSCCSTDVLPPVSIPAD